MQAFEQRNNETTVSNSHFGLRVYQGWDLKKKDFVCKYIYLMELNRNPTKSWAKILDLLSALIKKIITFLNTIRFMKNLKKV